ncbi:MULTISPECIES: VIT1/CCC1 transporter family protein [unclassified Pseudonocardia]|uniref:VIT1/CCC1 transporter family protein n=1 Tax=unclassified Pseudonocardia TaxID=2619320 RepID=UPI0001FFF3CF|nr:VIT1/CCC1 transporter family protein [Pseudonocardia sp. Ae707_Ps1]OLM16679.1 nodulin 21-related protein [Pseudonocardia sp. Ae707_Ps1]
MNDPELDAELAAHDHDHAHRDVSGGWLRAATFGAMDGLVTTIALVAGVGGGGAGRDVIVLTGLAGVVAGAFSMALGEFASVGTQNDAVDAEAAVERREIAEHPRAEQHELAEMYRGMGLPAGTADAVAREVHADPDLALRVHLSQELGVSLDDQPSPWVAAVSSFAAFVVGGIVPLVTFLLGYGSLALGLAVGGLGLLGAGALTSRFTSRSWWVAALRQLAFGAIAAGATYLVGMLIGVGVA